MRLAHFGCGLVTATAMLTGQGLSQERAAPRGLGCMTCMATSPGRIAPSAAEQRPIVPGEVASIEIALGRLRLERDHFKIISDHEAFPDGQGDRTLQVSFRHGGPALSAGYNDRQELWSLQFDSVIGARWTREYKDDGRPVRVAYTQRPHLPIEIEVTGMSARPFKMSGLSLWHLAQQNPPGFSTCVVPSLERLNPSFELRKTLAKAEEIGIEPSRGLDRLEPEVIKQCVIDLDASDHQLRAAALERLRQAGLAVHIPLARLVSGDLSVQQRQSLERLLDGLEPRTADTPTRLAYWLSGDPAWR